MKTTLTCPAKVNLFLAIREKDESGYHIIETILARTEKLQDFIHIAPAPEFSFHCDTLPAEGNTVVKAVQLLTATTNKKLNYKITLEKHIPPQSGLGGGSSNAAAILTYFNAKENLQLSHQELMELSAQIGMDVPFFTSGYPVAHATHYGEKITPLPDLPPDLQLQIQLTEHHIPTAEAYAAWDKAGYQSQADSATILKAIHSQDAAAIIQHLHNDFELISQYFEPASGTILAGSGGAHVVFDATNKSHTEKPE